MNKEEKLCGMRPCLNNVTHRVEDPANGEEYYCEEHAIEESQKRNLKMSKLYN